MSCSQLVEIEDLVLGTIEAARAHELRLHVQSCTACRLEEAAVSKERALFTQRSDLAAAPPVTIAVALRARLDAAVADQATSRTRASITGSHVGPARRGATRLLRRGAAGVAHVLRRGHVSVACAAVLFALVGLSKLGGAGVVPSAASGPARSEVESGPTASFFSPAPADEGLACVATGSPDDAAESAPVSSLSETQSSSSGATAREELACRNFSLGPARKRD